MNWSEFEAGVKANFPDNPEAADEFLRRHVLCLGKMDQPPEGVPLPDSPEALSALVAPVADRDLAETLVAAEPVTMTVRSSKVERSPLFVDAEAEDTTDLVESPGEITGNV